MLMEKHLIRRPLVRPIRPVPTANSQDAACGPVFDVCARLSASCCCLFCLIAALLLPRPCPAEQEEAAPHLLFKKSVVVKQYKGGAVYSEPRTIKKGEYLWKILREHYNLPNRKIAFYCKLAKAINPAIKDINQLRPNQNMLVPYKYEKGKQVEKTSAGDRPPPFVHTVRSGEHLAKILRHRCGLPEEIIFSSRTYRLIQEANEQIDDINELREGRKIIIPRELLLQKTARRDQPAAHKDARPSLPAAPMLGGTTITDNGTLSQGKRAHDMLSVLTRSFQGSDNRTGKSVISLDGKGTVGLDFQQFPVYTFPWGRKVLFDYGRRLPEGVKSVIASEWENAEIVAVREKEDMVSILGKVLDACGFYNVEKNGEYIVNNDNIQISISGNWIVFKDSSLKNVFIVNLVEGGEETVSADLKSYLADMGLEIMDINTDTMVKEGREAAYEKPVSSEQVPSEPMVLTDLILDILGIAYFKNFTTNVFEHAQDGFSLEVMADRMYELNGSAHLIDFNNLPRNICDIIVDQGYHLLQLDPHEKDVGRTVRSVLEFCGTDVKSSPATFQYDRAAKANMKLSIPGLLVETDTGDVLFTHIALKESVIRFLSEMDVKIIKY